jgi:hypothetical protein
MKQFTYKYGDGGAVGYIKQRFIEIKGPTKRLHIKHHILGKDVNGNWVEIYTNRGTNLYLIGIPEGWEVTESEPQMSTYR